MNPTLNKYIVAHFDLHGGKLKQKPILAYSTLEATQKYARSIGFTIGEDEVPNVMIEDHWFTAINVGTSNSLEHV